MTLSTRPPFPSVAPTADPGLRRLGLGGRGGPERPFRAQLVVVLVALVVLLAVPLYLWRRPSLHDGAVPSASASGSSATPGGIPSFVGDAGVPLAPTTVFDIDRVKLANPQKVRCGASRGKNQAPETCDALPFFEQALAKAIKDSVDCASRPTKGGTLNHVLEVDFRRHTVHVFAGASGEIKGKVARRICNCVERALPKPDWATLPHQQSYYAIAILATYAPASSPSSSLPGPTPLPPPSPATTSAHP